MSRDFDIIIVGAGVVGAVMASLVIARKLAAPGRVALIADRMMSVADEGADWDLRVFALSRASQHVLEQSGVWARLPRDRVYPYERMRVWDGADELLGRHALEFDCAELGEPNLGYIADGRVLQAHSLQAAVAAGAAVIEARVDGLSVGVGDCRIKLLDGREMRCQLLVAADGTESSTRTLLGIDTAGHAYNQDALVAHVRTAKPHRSTAWQRFLATGPLAFLPLPDGRSSIVWSASRAEAHRLAALEPSQFEAALTVASGGVLGRCELASSLARFPLKLQYAVDYIRPRAVLLGDAAHAVHPLAGQGLNLGLLDCAALAEVLGDGGNAGALGEHRTLRRYERWRRSENLLAAAALDGLERLFASPHPAVSQLRGLGLRTVGRLTLLKRELALRALGLSGDVPQSVKSRMA